MASSKSFQNDERLNALSCVTGSVAVTSDVYGPMRLLFKPKCETKMEINFLVSALFYMHFFSTSLYFFVSLCSTEYVNTQSTCTWTFSHEAYSKTLSLQCRPECRLFCSRHTGVWSVWICPWVGQESIPQSLGHVQQFPNPTVDLLSCTG